MANNNSINFPNSTTKSTPTTSDILLLSDQAAGGVLKQAAFSTFPAPTSLLSTDNSATVASFCASLPGAFSVTQSDTFSQGFSIQNTSISLVPFYLTTTWSATSIQTIVKTGFAGSTITMGIYASANGRPSGAALTAASVASTANNTLVSATISASLSANTLYWAALQASTSNTNLAITIGKYNFSAPNLFLYSTSTGVWTLSCAFYTNTYSAGTLPSITPASVSLVGFNYMPIMRIL